MTGKGNDLIAVSISPSPRNRSVPIGFNGYMTIVVQVGLKRDLMLDLPVHIDRHLYYPSSHPNQCLSHGASLLIPHCNFLDFLNLLNHQYPTTYRPS